LTEPSTLERTNDLTARNIGQRRTHAAPDTSKDVTSGVSVRYLSGSPTASR
jgi:hypothetical protein